MDNSPLVSVLMTAYNREKFISEAIESVLSSLFTNFELVIVDDCSDDKTVEIARYYAEKDSRIKVFVNESNLGDYPNRNKAAEYALGKYIKYVDSDDLLYDFALDVMVRYMERFPEAGFGLCSYHFFKPTPAMISPHEAYLSHFEVGHFNRPPMSAIIKLDAFKRIGGFSGARMIGDYEFWFRIARYYSMVILPRDLYYYRVHDGQEQNSAYAKNYRKLRQAVFIAAMTHPDCPLKGKRSKEYQKKELQEKLKKQSTLYPAINQEIIW